MERTLLSIVLAGLLTITITGCGDSSPKPKQTKIYPPCKQENISAPQWTCFPFADRIYAGVGVSKISPAGEGHMKRIALANGRSDLIKQIKSQVENKVETFAHSVGVNDTKTVTQLNIDVSKQISKINLQASKGIDTWTSPSGKLYMLVAIPKNSVNVEVKKAIKSTLKSDKTLEELDKEFPTD